MTTTDQVSLFCLGNPPNPPGGLRFLNGLVQADHSVRLIEFINTLSSSMLWTRRAIGEFWTLQCDGAPPPGVNPGPLFLAGFASGSVLIVPPSQTPGGRPETWHAGPVPGGFTLENLALRDAGVAARFLDGRPANGAVGLASNTDPPSTHWLVRPFQGSGPVVE